MKNLKELEEIIHEELGRTDYRGIISVRSSVECYSANVDLVDHSMRFGFNPNLGESFRTMSIVARDLPNHEYGHLGGKINIHINESGDYSPSNVLGIPGTIGKSEELFFRPIYRVLSKKGFSIEDANYFENCLEDTLLHLEGSKRRSWDGISRFFQLQNFSEFYEAHVRLNMILWGNLGQRELMSKKYTGSKKPLQAIARFLRRTGLIDKLRVSRDEMRNYLLDESNWSEISRIYAEEFSALASPNYARPTINHNGAGTSGKEGELSSEQGNVFQRQRKTDDYRRGRARKSYDDGKELPEWMKQTDEDEIKSLDLLYDSLLSDLEIKAQSRTVSDALPIGVIVSREFNPLFDLDTDTSVKIDDAGNPALYVSRKSLELPYEIKAGELGYPLLKVVLLDTSESMKEGIDENGIGRTQPIPFGDNSKQHYSLLAVKATLKSWILRGLLVDKNSFELDNFSTRTKTGKGLDEAKRVMFKPQWGSTYLDKERVREIFNGSGNLVFTISDGAICNWEDIKSDFLEGAKRNHYFHFQIGEDSGVTEEMRAEGLHVEKCKGHQDLIGRVIDLNRRIELRE